MNTPTCTENSLYSFTVIHPLLYPRCHALAHFNCSHFNNTSQGQRKTYIKSKKQGRLNGETHKNISQSFSASPKSPTFGPQSHYHRNLHMLPHSLPWKPTAHVTIPTITHTIKAFHKNKYALFWVFKYLLQTPHTHSVPSSLRWFLDKGKHI